MMIVTPSSICARWCVRTSVVLPNKLVHGVQLLKLQTKQITRERTTEKLVVDFQEECSVSYQTEPHSV